MRRKGLIAASIMALAASTASVTVTPAFAQDKQVEATQNAEAKKIVDKVLNRLHLRESPTTIGNIEFNKADNVITAHNLKQNAAEGFITYKSVVIKGYKEDAASGSYSIDHISGSEMNLELTEPYRKSIQEHQEAQGKPLPADIPKSILFDSFTYDGVTGSTKEHFLKVSSSTLKGMSFPDSDLNELVDLSKVEGTLRNWSVSKTDVLAAASEKFQKSAAANKISKEEFNELTTLTMDNMSIEHFSFKGFPRFDGPDGESFKVDKIALNGWEKGEIREISIYDFELETPDSKDLQTGKIGKITFSGLKLSEFIKLSSQIEEQQPDPTIAAKMLQLIGGIAFQDMDLKGKKESFKGGFDISWGKFVGLFPTTFKWTGQAEIDVPKTEGDKDKAFANPNDLPALMKQAGIDKLNLKFDMGLKWDEKTNTLTLTPFIYDVDKMFSFSFDAVVGNLPKELLLEQDPDKMMVFAMGSTAGKMTIEISDKGFQKLYEAQAKGTFEGASAGFAGDPRVKPIVDNMTKLLKEPDGTFKLVLTPKTAVPFAQLSAAVMVDPMSLFDLFDIETSYAKQ